LATFAAPKCRPTQNCNPSPLSDLQARQFALAVCTNAAFANQRPSNLVILCHIQSHTYCFNKEMRPETFTNVIKFVRPDVLSLLGCFYRSRRFDGATLSSNAVLHLPVGTSLRPTTETQQHSCNMLTSRFAQQLKLNNTAVTCSRLASPNN
jgi:hypothetical protein